MASAEDLRKFATSRLLQQGLGVPSLAEERIFPSGPSEGTSPDVADELLRVAGEVVERAGWLSLGIKIGYFDGPWIISAADRAVVHSASGLIAESTWPSWVKNQANFIVNVEPPSMLWAGVGNSSPETVAVFQAAMILAANLRDPLISDLQWSLQSSESLLDLPHAAPDTASIEREIHDSPEASTSDRFLLNISTCIAGFIRMVEVMGALDNLFDDLLPTDFGDTPLDPRISIQLKPMEPLLDSEIRAAIAREVCNLMSWRLNLRDELIVRRLSVVVNAFWQVCEREMKRLPTGMSWSGGASYIALADMFLRWRDRTSPEPDTVAAELSILDRSLFMTAKTSDQSQRLAET
jgi:hypothetical protein